MKKLKLLIALSAICLAVKSQDILTFDSATLAKLKTMEFPMVASVNSRLQLCVGYRNYADSSGKYLIKYVYDPSWGIIPLTAFGSAAHYDAQITVSRIIHCRCIWPKYDTIIVGKPFHGTYVPGGCYEDNPQGFVKYALSIEN